MLKDNKKIESLTISLTGKNWNKRISFGERIK